MHNSRMHCRRKLSLAAWCGTLAGVALPGLALAGSPFATGATASHAQILTILTPVAGVIVLFIRIHTVRHFAGNLSRAGPNTVAHFTWVSAFQNDDTHKQVNFHERNNNTVSSCMEITITPYMLQRTKTMKTRKLSIRKIKAIDTAFVTSFANITTHMSDGLLRMEFVFDYRADKRDTGHNLRIGNYARLKAAALGYPHNDVGNIPAAANLHNIGNISVLSHDLRKPTSLDSDVWLLMETHCIDEATLLRSLPHPIALRASTAAEADHECSDGSGNSKALTGDNIPLPARIVAVADVFDARTTPNAVHRGMPNRAPYWHIQSLAARYRMLTVYGP
jgi:HD-GYP domain-containing protein (c-di-GMP phosphodiesterase class II)